MIGSVKGINQVSDREWPSGGTLGWMVREGICEGATMEQRHGSKIRDTTGKACKAETSWIS